MHYDYNHQSHFDRYYGNDHNQFMNHYGFNNYGYNGGNYSAYNMNQVDNATRHYNGNRYEDSSSHVKMIKHGQGYTMTEAMNQYRSVVAQRYALPNTGQSDSLSLEYLLLLVGSLLVLQGNRKKQTK